MPVKRPASLTDNRTNAECGVLESPRRPPADRRAGPVTVSPGHQAQGKSQKPAEHAATPWTCPPLRQSQGTEGLGRVKAPLAPLAAARP